MNGSEYIAEFLARVEARDVFVLTGGACAFMIDAVARHPDLRYVCFQHEQAAAMAADAVWRVTQKVGVTMATSGPGATNLITGIACSYFDSIPTLHITGQVNRNESAAYMGAPVRQAGFQETRIVDIVRPITKYAVMVESAEQLRHELAKAYSIAISGRMGPVLIDVPMNVQQEAVAAEVILPEIAAAPALAPASVTALRDFFSGGERPLVLFGAGVGLAGAERQVIDWINDCELPFASSWSGLSFFDHDLPAFCGAIGVYGNRGANFILQNCDRLLVLGSRLDNRQRSGNRKNFASGARVHVIDIDDAELKKYPADGYETTRADLRAAVSVLAEIGRPPRSPAWASYISEMKTRYFRREDSSSARRLNSLSPYDVVRKIGDLIDPDAIVVADAGASLCWVYQAFRRRGHTFFTAAGNSPMGYALPAAIGAKLVSPKSQVIVFIGDGSFQINIQELQTIANYGLDITIFVMNNQGYGIIKQFQDSYLGGRYDASGKGYANPDFAKVAEAYGLRYRRVEGLDVLTEELFGHGATVVDVILNPNTLIEPKLEMGRPINDQFPYLPDDEYADANRFVAYPRPQSASPV